MIKLIFKHLKKIDWLFMFISIGLIVLQVYLEFKIPEYTSALTRIANDPTTNSNSLPEVYKNGGLMLLCAVSSMIAGIICSLFVSTISSRFSMSVRNELYKKIFTFSNKEIHKFHTASLITRTTNDVVQLQNFMSMGLQLLVKAPVMAIWGICKISATEISWTIATLVAVVIIVVVVSSSVIICLPRFKKIQKLTDDLNAQASENITGVRVIRAFNAEDYQNKKYENVNKTITKNNLVTSETMGLISPILSLVMNGLVLAIYWIGAVLINNMKVEDYSTQVELIVARGQKMADMVAFTSYGMQIVMAFIMLILVFIILPRTIVSAKRINEVFNTVPSIVDGSLDDNNIKEKGTIRLENVSFSYADDEHHLVLKDINLNIERGETVAIIGPTGCGKSTLINLIMRYYDVSNGNILVDGYNIKDYKLNDLRKRYSLATQKAMLFKGTIKENIALGIEEKDIDKERFDKSIDIASCNFIDDLELKENSEVAQGGSNFSGGQKQRMSIARTLYKDSEIMVFDDTFSALDYKTDFNVRKKIKENLKDKTVIIIAQRIGTIKNSDKIVVMKDGQIDAIGKHDELLKTSKVYQEIALSQLSKEEL